MITEGALFNTDKGTFDVTTNTLVHQSDYSTRFDELLSMGYSWITFVAAGIQDDNMIVVVELPEHPTGVPSEKTAVNFSGPSESVANTWKWNLKFHEGHNITLTYFLGLRRMLLFRLAIAHLSVSIGWFKLVTLYFPDSNAFGNPGTLGILTKVICAPFLLVAILYSDIGSNTGVILVVLLTIIFYCLIFSAYFWTKRIQDHIVSMLDIV